MNTTVHSTEILDTSEFNNLHELIQALEFARLVINLEDGSEYLTEIISEEDRGETGLSRLQVIAETLSDGSKAYSVKLT